MVAPVQDGCQVVSAAHQWKKGCRSRPQRKPFAKGTGRVSGPRGWGWGGARSFDWHRTTRPTAACGTATRSPRGLGSLRRNVRSEGGGLYSDHWLSRLTSPLPPPLAA